MKDWSKEAGSGMVTNMKVTLEIPDQVANALAEGQAQEPRSLLLELACGLYAARKLTHAQAAELAGMTRMEFQEALGFREIPVHYTSEELADDIAFARRQ
jgi:predicted HTH domain antitoxin